MAGWAIAAALAVGTAHACLVVACWKRRSILGGVCGAAGVALVVFAISSGPATGTGEGSLVIALVVLLIGTVLLGIGQAVWRLLDDEGGA